MRRYGGRSVGSSTRQSNDVLTAIDAWEVLSMTESTMVNVAVIGCGKVAQNMHLPALSKSSRCRLVAVCDESRYVAEAVGGRYAIERIYTSAERALADELVDAVIIAVGDPLHVQIAAQALEAGKHVLVEKPLGSNAAECRPLQELVSDSGLVLQVGVMKRHDPGLEYAGRAVHGSIGRVTSFGVWYHACADRYVDESSIFLPVIRDPAYTRPTYKLDLQPYYLATHGAHLFDTIRYVVGPPHTVQALLGKVGETYSWHGLLRMHSGAVGHFGLTVYTEGDWSEGLNVFGDAGSVTVRSPNPFFLRPSEVRVFDAGSSSWHTPLFEAGDAYLRQIDAFAESILNGAAVVADVVDGIAALETIEAVTRSVDAGGAEVAIKPSG